MIADVVFDLPLDHPFSYLVPDSLTVTPGQRVSAPLGGRGTRVGVVVALRDGDAAGLRPIQRAVEPAPILSAGGRPPHPPRPARGGRSPPPRLSSRYYEARHRRLSSGWTPRGKSAWPRHWATRPAACW